RPRLRSPSARDGSSTPRSWPRRRRSGSRSSTSRTRPLTRSITSPGRSSTSSGSPTEGRGALQPALEILGLGQALHGVLHVLQLGFHQGNLTAQQLDLFAEGGIGA